MGLLSSLLVLFLAISMIFKHNVLWAEPGYAKICVCISTYKQKKCRTKMKILILCLCKHYRISVYIIIPI